MQAGRYLFLASLLAGISLFAGNIAAQKLLAGVRIDFTSGKLFTLSNGTRETLRSIAEPVDITLVYSRAAAQDYPAVRAHADRVRELLGTYAAQSEGRVRVREINPSPFSPAEDEALAAGISGLPATSGDPLYFGIIGRNTIDDLRVIPFLAPEREATLEYDLTRMIARLDDPDPPRVGILSALPGMATSGEDSGYMLLQDIARSFEIERIPETFEALPDDLDVLLVAHPPELSRRQEWLIDQFILRRGRAVFLIDPAAKTAAAEGVFGREGARLQSGLGTLGRAWGITLAPEAVADAAHALPVPVETGPGRVEELAHPLFMAIPAAEMNREDVITADLMRAVNFGAPGALLFGDPPDSARLTPLIVTGPSPSFIDARQAAGNLTPAATLRAYASEPGPLVLAARLSGRLRTAFPGGAPAFDEPQDAAGAERARAAAASAAPHIAASEVDAEIVFIADIDLLADAFYIVPGSTNVVADNGALVLNALDAVSGGGALAQLRSRAPGLRPMARVDRMREAAEAQFFRQQDALEERLAIAQSRLAELQSRSVEAGFAEGDPEASLSADERIELARLRDDILDLRARVREIERIYRRDIDRLEAILKAINIWGGPALVGFAGLLVWYNRKRQRMRIE